MAPHAPTAAGPRTARLRTLGLLVIVALVAGAWWQTNPRAVDAYGDKITVEVPVGDTVLVDAGVYPAASDGGSRSEQVISLSEAVPRLAENSAAADVDVVLCRRQGTGTDLIGTIFAASCDEVPIAGATEAVPITAQLVVRITPHQPGAVRVEGIDLTYRDGLQRGTVRTGTLIETSTN